MKLLRESGVDFDRVDYIATPLARGKLAQLAKKMGVAPRELLRRKERAYKDLDLGRPGVTEGEILDVIAEHPELLERPIVERGGRALLARPAERVREIL